MAADRDPESIDRLLASRGVKPIDFAGWKKVDAFERAEGAKEGREHKKVIDRSRCARWRMPESGRLELGWEC